MEEIMLTKEEEIKGLDVLTTVVRSAILIGVSVAMVKGVEAVKRKIRAKKNNSDVIDIKVDNVNEEN